MLARSGDSVLDSIERRRDQARQVLRRGLDALTDPECGEL